MIPHLAFVAPQLVTGEPAGWHIPWGTLLLAVLVIALIGAAVFYYRRARDRSGHADRAVRRLARLLGLDDRELSALHAMSVASGIHASALLVSKRAFERATEAAEASSRPPKPALVRALAGKTHPGAR